MPLQRYRVAMSGFTGGPGIMTLYLSTSVADYAPIRIFATSLASVQPNGLTYTFPSSIDIINESNGQLTGSIGVTPPAVVTSIVASAPYSAPSGAIIRWVTSAIINGTRLVGRTFVVPLAQTSYQADGTLASATITTLQNAANTLLSSYGDGIKVWSRPKPTIAGQYATALSGTVPDMAAILRSRRT